MALLYHLSVGETLLFPSGSSGVGFCTGLFGVKEFGDGLFDEEPIEPSPDEVGRS
ncbi:MAG: hypothetical protein LBE76_01950 [Nitrososphaerota archaeon]|nr:hypothetical protein [Nitrososphaerota archaeon]